MNGLFTSCLWKNSGDRCFHLLLFVFFFIPNITAICKNKIPPSSEPEVISKELENSHLSFFSVNLTDIFNMHRQISSESYLQISSKIVICRLVETHNLVHNILSLLMFDHVTTRVCLNYSVNDCNLRVYKLRALFISFLIR